MSGTKSSSAGLLELVREVGQKNETSCHPQSGLYVVLIPSSVVSVSLRGMQRIVQAQGEGA